MRNVFGLTRLVRVPLVILGLVALGACGDDTGDGAGGGGVGSTATPVFSVDPTSLAFSSAGIGEQETQRITVTNAAGPDEGDLLLRSLEIDAPTSADVDWCGQPGCTVYEVRGFENNTRLAPGESRTYDVVFYSVTEARSNGELRFQTNARETNLGEVDDGIGRVTLISASLGGRLFVTPDPINFGRVPADAGEPVCIDVSLRNVGNAALTLTDYKLVGGGGQFFIVEGGRFEDLGVEAVALAANDSLPVPMCFLPANDNTAEATMIVSLGDGSEEVVDVIGNGAEPCLDITFENGYDFGLVPTTSPRRVGFTITNCAPVQNGETLVVDTLELLDNDTFSPLAYSLLDTPTLALSLEPGEAASFQVQCAPEDIDVIYQGGLLVQSNDTLKEELEIPLNCTGSDLTPPECIVECRLTGTELWNSQDLLVAPLDTVECTARRSSDADGYIISWEWETESLPGGSVTSFNPRAAETSSLFVDFSGRYDVTAICTDDSGLTNEIVCDSDGDRVYDAAGCARSGIECPEAGGTVDYSNCDLARTDRVTILARPEDDIQVELAWTTPGDPDETDVGFNAGSDVDLHVLHPNGCWNDTTWDCFFNNTNANWGNVASDDDNAELDIDDTDGAGPETVSIDSPESVTYRVGVHYYDDHGYGVSFASIRIYVFGILAAEFLDQELVGNDYWWEVATIEWPSGAVTPIDRVFNAEPPCE